MNFLKIFIFIILIPWTISAEKLTIVTNLWYPYFDAGLKNNGLSAEILSAAMEGRGYELEFKEIPWSRAEEGVKTGSYDVLLNVWKTDERLMHFLYSDAYINNRLVFLKKKSDTFEFEDLHSLRGKKIGTIRGYYYDEEFMKADNLHLVPANDSLQNIQKLDAGRIDIFIEDEAVIKNILKKEFPQGKTSLAFCKKTFMEKELYLAINLKNEKASAFIKSFNEGLKEIKENGKYKKILLRYDLIP